LLHLRVLENEVLRASW